MALNRLYAATFLSLALLSACTTNSHTNMHNASVVAAPTIAIAQKDTKILGYFSEDGDFSNQPYTNGYVRKYLGRTATGEAVLQDFYAVNGKPQTNVFTIFDDAGLENWDTLQYTNGLVQFFYADGKPYIESLFKKGEYVSSKIYHRNGQIFKQQHFKDGGIMLNEVFFDPQGKPILAVDYDLVRNDDDDVHFKIFAFDEQQQKIELDKNNTRITASIEQAQQYYRHILQDEAFLAGQQFDESNMPLVIGLY